MSAAAGGTEQTGATVTPGPGYVAADDGGQDVEHGGRPVVGLVVAVVLGLAAGAGLAWFAYQARRQGAVGRPAGEPQQWEYDGGPVPTVDPGRPPQGESEERPADAAGEADGDG